MATVGVSSSGSLIEGEVFSLLLFVRGLDLKKTLNEYSGVERYFISSREAELAQKHL